MQSPSGVSFEATLGSAQRLSGQSLKQAIFFFIIFASWAFSAIYHWRREVLKGVFPCTHRSGQSSLPGVLHMHRHSLLHGEQTSLACFRWDESSQSWAWEYGPCIRGWQDRVAFCGDWKQWEGK